MNNPFESINERLQIIEGLLQALAESQSEIREPSGKTDDLLTIEQAAEFLHLSKPTIYSKCSRNELPYMKRGKRLYFLREQLMEYVKAGQHETKRELSENANEFLKKKKGGQNNG